MLCKWAPYTLFRINLKHILSFVSAYHAHWRSFSETALEVAKFENSDKVVLWGRSKTMTSQSLPESLIDHNYPNCNWRIRNCTLFVFSVNEFNHLFRVQRCSVKPLYICFFLLSISLTCRLRKLFGIRLSTSFSSMYCMLPSKSNHVWIRQFKFSAGSVRIIGACASIHLGPSQCIAFRFIRISVAVTFLIIIIF